MALDQAASRPLRIGITVDPEIPVPPRHYGGIERIVDGLVRGLCERGHQVTLFAHPDSRDGPCRLVAYPGRRSGSHVDTLRHMRLIAAVARAERLEVIHSFARLAYLLPLMAAPIPKLMTYQRHISPRSVRLAAWMSRGTLGFTAISRSMLTEVAALADWRVVPNCAETRRYRYQPQIGPDAPLMFLGRVEHIKGPHLAIEVARRAGRRLVIAGNVSDGAEHRRYFDERIAPHVDGERVRYVGAVDDTQKNEWLGGAAALLMPVLWSEPFGIVMVESLACGTPVIGLRNGAVPEVVDDGRTGFVCDSVDEMVEAVGRLHTIGRAACRRAVEERFSEDVVVESYLAIYRELAAKVAAAGRAARAAS